MTAPPPAAMHQLPYSHFATDRRGLKFNATSSTIPNRNMHLDSQVKLVVVVRKVG
jgi:hypothetical protein